MNQYVKRTQRDYSLSFKLSVVEQVEKGEITYRQAQERYGIQGASTVLNWLRKYGHLDWHSSSRVFITGDTGRFYCAELVTQIWASRLALFLTSFYYWR